MWRIICISMVCIFIPGMLSAQEYKWKADFDYFFDNVEYEKTPFADSQTMQGIWISPLGGATWDSLHSLYGGVNLLVLPGSKATVDKVDVTLFYQYKTPNVLFRAGSFSRSEVLSNYNNFFFTDSISNFKPLMEGVFWQIGTDDKFFNMWMDWTGYADSSTRESFFVGLSGKATKGALFADFQSYMYHNANTRPNNINDFGVRENMLLQASLGLNIDNQKGFEGLLSAGALLGYERDRTIEDALDKPVGFTARANAEYWGVGTQNTMYVGDPRMVLYDTYGADLYWGTPFLRGKSYLESEWYIHLLDTDRAKARFNFNVHFSEGNVLYQQLLTVSATIGKFSTQKNGKGRFPWMKIFQ